MRHRPLEMRNRYRIRAGGKSCRFLIAATLQAWLWIAPAPVQAAGWDMARSKQKQVEQSPTTGKFALSWESYRNQLNQAPRHWVTEDTPIDAADIELQRQVDQALGVEARNGGRDSDRIAMLLSFRANTLSRQRKWRESLDDFHHADTLLQDVPDSEHLRDMIAYPAAVALNELGQGPDAIRLLQPSLEGLRTSVPATNYLYSESLALLGILYCNQKECRTGLALLQKAQEVDRGLGDPSSLSFIDYGVAEASFWTGQIEQAQLNNAEALRLDTQAPSGDLHAAKLLQQQGRIFLELQDIPDAQRAFQNAVDLYQTMDGHHSQDIQHCRAGFAVALLAQNRVEEAATMAQEIMVIYEQEQWMRDWELSDAAYVVGVSAQQRREFKAARVHLFQSWRIRSLMMSADAVTVQRGLDLSELLRDERDWQNQRDEMFAWLYPQLDSVKAPVLSKVRVTEEWAEILHARHLKAEEMGVRKALRQQCVQAQAAQDSAAEEYCNSLKPFRVASARE
jgi:tetratricopeptide (TPR) repeat protein